MDKKNIVIAVLLIFVGVLSFFLFYKDKEKNMAFENSFKCTQYVDQQTKQVNDIRQSNLEQGKSVIVSGPKVFFSSKLNTCVSAYSISDLFKDGFDSFYINNLFNNDSILSEGGEKNQTIDNISLAKIAEQKYLEKLKELGGE